MIRLQQTADGVLLTVKAHAGARRSAITGEHDGALKVSVTQAPEKGRANLAIAALLASALQINVSDVELTSGQSNRQKRFLVRNISLDALQAKLTEALTRRA